VLLLISKSVAQGILIYSHRLIASHDDARGFGRRRRTCKAILRKGAGVLRHQSEDGE
jgi:hypothetical protein